MPTLDELDPSIFFGMLKGEPGTRKSTSALSFPTPQYWFSTDQKMDALTLPSIKWGINRKEINYDDFTDYNALRQKLESFQVKCNYKTLVLDSITSTADATNRQTLKAKSGTTNKSGEEKGSRVGGIAINTMEDYKAEAAAFSAIMAMAKDISIFHGVNFVFIAHVIGDRKNETGSTHFARIICTGGKIISAKIPAYCKEVYHFNIRPNPNISQGDEYGILTTHSGDDFARTIYPLEKEIYFNNNPLYPTYIKPAIDKLVSGKV